MWYVVDWFLWKPFWFFPSIISILGFICMRHYGVGAVCRQIPWFRYFWTYFINLFLFFLTLLLLSTESSSSCPCLMSNWLLIIFEIGSCVSFGGFPSKFSKCVSFHWCIRSSWLVAYRFSFRSAFSFCSLRLASALLS